MTKEEVQKTIKIMEEAAKEIGKSRGKTLALLHSTGAYTKNGNLKKAYKITSSD